MTISREDCNVQTVMRRFSIQSEVSDKGTEVETGLSVTSGVKRKVRDMQKSESRVAETTVEKKRRVEGRVDKKLEGTNSEKGYKSLNSEDSTKIVEGGPRSKSGKFQDEITKDSEFVNCELKPEKLLPWHSDETNLIYLKRKCYPNQ